MDAAIDQQHKIVIVGDYDADGATSTAFNDFGFARNGAQVEYLVPDRFKYGLWLNACDCGFSIYQLYT